MSMHIPIDKWTNILLAVLIGGIGAGIAKWLGAPIPFMLGSLLATMAVALSGKSIAGHRPYLPTPFRNIFVAVIGVMIGSNFQPGFFGSLGAIWVPVLGVVFFVIIAFTVNFVVFRTLGKYDTNTAFFAAMPGGWIESIAFGEKLGADIQILTIHQLSRVTLVIMTLPFLFLLWTGEKVGSSAGVTIGNGGAMISLWDWLVLGVCTVAGLYGGKALRLPASILVGPLILSAAAHSFGLITVSPPSWLISFAQIIVGTGLGERFHGIRPVAMFKSIAIAFLSVLLMLAIDAGFVSILVKLQDQPFDVLLISFAPGGVTETALIALSLDANPVFVTTLHVVRILVTVGISSIGFGVLKCWAYRKSRAE